VTISAHICPLERGKQNYSASYKQPSGKLVPISVTTSGKEQSFNIQWEINFILEFDKTGSNKSEFIIKSHLIARIYISKLAKSLKLNGLQSN